VEPSIAGELAGGIDRVFEDAAKHVGGYKHAAATAWYSRYRVSADDLFVARQRPWVESAAGVYLGDSPRMAFDFVELLLRLRIPDVIEGYLGERPALSIAKSTLRRVPSTMQVSAWHQDGAFLGPGIRSVNLWLTLSDCGEYAPGLDLVPKRLREIVETGTHGTPLSWAVGDGLIQRISQDAPVVSPNFRAGDALLFDHLLLHRTSLPPKRRLNRYAIESWFFAPSRYPLKQHPLVL
jgi:hypothetical protein